MSTLHVQITVVALFASSCGVLAFAWSRGRLGLAAAGVLVVAAAGWVFALAAISTEYRGASEFATCGDDCGAVQYAAAVAFLAPPLLIALAALAMLIVRGSRWRARRAAGGEPA